jgi:O-antigen/teichoic acid export membrane protein
MELFKRSVKMLVVIMVPAALILGIFGPFVLRIFGRSYSEGGSSVIIVLAIAAPAVAAYALGGTLLRIMRKVKSLIFINCIYTATIIGLTLFWIQRGLVWVAIAWTIGNAAAAILAFLFLYYRRS